MSGDDRGGQDIEAGERPGAAAQQDLEEGRKELRQSAASEGAGKVNTDGGGGGGGGGGEASSPNGSRGENEGGPQGGRLTAAAAEQRRRVVSDPISESYRSIVEVINRTSEGFREGKKWKCAAGAPIKAERQKQQQQQQQAQQQVTQRAREHRKATARHRSRGGGGAMERSHTTDGDGGGARGGGAKEKRLVRQAACAAEDASAAAQQLLSAPAGAHLRLSPTAGRALPTRQWTVDACTAPAFGQAYLLRPVSRSSIRSAASGGDDCGGGGGGRRLSPAGAPGESQCAGGSRAKSAARSPAAERERLDEIGNRNSGRSFSASFNIETNDGATVSIRSSTSRSGSGRTAATLTATRHRMRKQRTCDSAPMRGGTGGGTAGTAASLGGSNRHLPRQFSNASAYSAAAAAAFIPTSISHQGMTLVRGASCSLVDIPTYLGQSYGGVELAQICDVKMVPAAAASATAACGGAAAFAPTAALEESPASGAAGDDAADLSQQRKSARPRLQVRWRRT